MWKRVFWAYKIALKEKEREHKRIEKSDPRITWLYIKKATAEKLLQKTKSSNFNQGLSKAEFRTMFTSHHSRVLDLKWRFKEHRVKESFVFFLWGIDSFSREIHAKATRYQLLIDWMKINGRRCFFFGNRTDYRRPLLNHFTCSSQFWFSQSVIFSSLC